MGGKNSGPRPDPRRRALSQRFIGRIRRYCQDHCQAQYKLSISIDMHPDTLSRFLSGKLTAIPGHPKLKKLAGIVGFYGPILEENHEQASQASPRRGAKRNEDQANGSVHGRTAATKSGPEHDARPRRGDFGPGKNRSRVSTGGHKI